MALLLILALLLKLPLFLYPKPVLVSQADGKLYQLLAGWLNTAGGGNFLAGLLSFLLIYIQALMITSMVNEYRMTNKPGFLPGMAYVLITSLMPEWNYLSAALVANTLIIWAFSLLFQLYNVSAANGRVYNIGLLMGFASFIHFPSLGLALSLLIGLMILKPFRLNEFFLLLLGVTTPYYFYGVYLFLADQFHWQNFFPPLTLHVPLLQNSIWVVISTVLLGVPFLAGGFYIQTQLRKMLIQARKNWSVMLMYLLIAIFIPFVNSDNLFTNWALAIPPFAAFHAAGYLYPPRKWVSVLLFFLFVGFILFQQYVVNIWR